VSDQRLLPTKVLIALFFLIGEELRDLRQKCQICFWYQFLSGMEAL